MNKNEFRTWIEIDRNATLSNIKTLQGIVGSNVKIWAVVKSNAYGHGLFLVPQIIEKTAIYGFCVDSIVEAIKLREDGIKKPILVLGFTPLNYFATAKAKDIILTISNKEVLSRFLKEKSVPDYHVKIDTGMHRQGFFVDEIDSVISSIRSSAIHTQALKGIYTHFASAKDINYPTYTDMQFEKFNQVAAKFKMAGFLNIMRHASATGGMIINPKYHLDAIRAGIGLYGLWPSKELELQMSDKINFKPVLSWHTAIGEIKNIKSGSFIGYDLAERVSRDSKIAILPIGYWHGYSRLLSGCGNVIINGHRARVLGRVSMDMITVDVTGIKCKFGDRATLIGRNGKETIKAGELASGSNTSHYEIVTRLNPLIERIAV